MFETLLKFDKNMLVFLNGLGSDQWDSFWLYATKQFNWVPLFVVVLFLLLRYLGWKKWLFLLFFTALLIAFSDQFTNMIRVIFKRSATDQRPLSRRAFARFDSTSELQFYFWACNHIYSGGCLCHFVAAKPFQIHQILCVVSLGFCLQ